MAWRPPQGALRFRRGWFLLLLLGSCTHPPASPRRDASRAATPSVSASASAPLTPAPPVAEPDFLEFARAREWEQAATAFDRQYPSPDEPRLRFFRARIAEALGDAEGVLRHTDGLAARFSEFAPEIERWRRQALAARGETGKLAPAGDTFAERLAAARGIQDAGDLVGALRGIDALLREKGAAREAEYPNARAVRGQLLLDLGRRTEAAREFRWLALKAPTAAGAADAVARIHQAGGPQLTWVEHHRRAEAFLDARRFADSLEALAAADASRPQARPLPALLRTRAWVLYKSRSDYEEAARLFGLCAETDPAHRVQDLFYQARALSRADKDEAALVLYQRLVKRYPRSAWSVEASYFAARLHFIHGQWDSAASDYAGYLRRYRRGKHRAAVLHEAAVSELARGKGAAALALLDKLRPSVSSPRHLALLDELRAVALSQSGDLERAKALFAEVATTRPLSFAALMSRARLTALGAALPPAMPPSEPAPPPEPLQLRWSSRVRTLIDLGLDGDAEAELVQRRDEFRAGYGERGGEALCRAFGELNTAAARYAHAQRIVRERVLQRALTVATRWLWECIYPTPYSELVRHQETTLHLPPGLLYAVMRQESGFRETVRSPVGAIGLMQIMPRTGAHIATELGNTGFEPGMLARPAVSIRFGAHYLENLLQQFGGSVPLAVAAYNAGPTALKRWLGAADALPLDLFVAHIPYAETRHYVSRVVGNWARYQYLQEPSGNPPPLGLALPKWRRPAPTDY